MFKMTADIKFEGLKAVKPSSLTWARSLDNYSDSATIVIPALCRLINKVKTYENVATGQQIKEGLKVELHAGYDGKNNVQFMGFVNRINFKVPLEIECEGYSYQLRRKVINKTFGKTTVKAVLEYLIADTDIKLSDKMPERIDFEPMRFENYTGTQILDFLKQRYLLTVCFFFNELYVGWRATYKGDVVKHRLNWNVIKDDSLLFNTYTGAIVHIQLESRSKNGVKNKKKASNVFKPGNVKTKRVFIQNEEDKQQAANDAQILNNKRGYTGALTTFLHPHVIPGMTTQIIDKKYEERNGRYLVESVEGGFNTSGGRLKIGIGFTVNNNG